MSHAPPFKGPYGMANKASDSKMSTLIEGGYTDWTDDTLDYPDLSSLKQAHKLKPPKGTKASMGHDVRCKEQEASGEHAPFKMKRFANVKGRVFA